MGDEECSNKGKRIASVPISEDDLIDSSNTDAEEDFKDPAKIRTETLRALYIQIGTWRRDSINDEDLKVKFFFASREIALEILEDGCRSKIEMNWSDIAAIQAVRGQEGEPGILHIELNQSPEFHLAFNPPHPRMYLAWEQVADFTDGQASRNRLHRIVLRPGELENRYEKIINRDQVLLHLNQGLFPRRHDLFFGQATPDLSSTFSRDDANGTSKRQRR